MYREGKLESARRLSFACKPAKIRTLAGRETLLSPGVSASIAACSVIDPLSVGASDAGSRATLALSVVTAKRDFPKGGQLQ